MSKDLAKLPYFEFIPTEWLQGDITLEDLQTQGLYINICSLYWFNNCSMSIAKLKRRLSITYGDIEADFNNLLNNKIIEAEEDGNIAIKFLDEQYKYVREHKKIQVKNGRKGGISKAKKQADSRVATFSLKQKCSDPLANSSQPSESENEKEKESKQTSNKEIKKTRKVIPETEELKVKKSSCLLVSDNSSFLKTIDEMTEKGFNWSSETLLKRLLEACPALKNRENAMNAVILYWKKVQRKKCKADSWNSNGIWVSKNLVPNAGRYYLKCQSEERAEKERIIEINNRPAIQCVSNKFFAERVRETKAMLNVECLS